MRSTVALPTTALRTTALRMALLALSALLVACGSRLTPPDVPPARGELDRLARAQAERTLSPIERRRLAVLLERYDNAPERADLLDVQLDDRRARQAHALRAWSRLRPDWAGIVARAIAADPADAGGAALAVLLSHASDDARASARAALTAEREGLRPITRCIVDALAASRSPCTASPDLDAAIAELSAADPTADPEADRLAWTLAHFGPAHRPRQAAAAAQRWIRAWPRHAAAWTAAGASAAVDPDGTAAERLAWSGAAWIRATSLHPGAFRAHAALADLERRAGLPAAATRHRLDARRAVGDARPLPEPTRHPTRPRASSALPARPTANAIRQATERRGAVVPAVLLDRAVVRVEPGRAVVAEVQRLATTPWPAAPGCDGRRHGPTGALHEQICRTLLIPVDDALEIAFPTARAAARGEIVVHAPRGTAPAFQSHGGAPGAEVAEGPGETHYAFVLDDIDPRRDAPRRPRVRVSLAGIGGPIPIPAAGMIDRLAVFESAAEPPPVAGDVRRTVARLRAADRRAEAAWVVVDGQPQPLWAVVVEGEWRWFDALGRPAAVEGPIVAASRAAWIGRAPATITRAVGDDLPSSSAADTDRDGSGRR